MSSSSTSSDQRLPSSNFEGFFAYHDFTIFSLEAAFLIERTTSLLSATIFHNWFHEIFHVFQVQTFKVFLHTMILRYFLLKRNFWSRGQHLYSLLQFFTIDFTRFSFTLELELFWIRTFRRAIQLGLFKIINSSPSDKHRKAKI